MVVKIEILSQADEET